MKGKILNTIFSFFLISHFCYSQNKATLVSTFVSLSDSVLIKKDVDNELKILLDNAKNKEIVAIGEATHGTDEIIGFQTLIAKKFIEIYNFKTIVLGEFSLLESYKLYNYSINGEGDINKIIQGPKKLKEFIIWLKNYNKNKDFGQKIVLIGSDVDNPISVIEFIENYLKENELDFFGERLKELVFKLNRDKVLNVNELNEIEGLFFEIKNKINEKAKFEGKSDFKISLINVVLNNFLKCTKNSLDFNFHTQKRDAIIYSNIEWIKSLNNHRIVIIQAHNFHVNKETINTESFDNQFSFGELINKKYKSKYFCIGTEIQKGQFSAFNERFVLVQEHKNKLGNQIGAISNSNFGLIIIDSLNRNYFNNPKLKISKGTSINFSNQMIIDGKSKIGNAFDAIFYIKESQPYIYEENYFTLFIKPDSLSISNALEKGSMKIDLETSSIDSLNNSNLGVFINDENKKILYSLNLKLMNISNSLTIEIPKNCKYISININIRNTDNFILKSVLINDMQVNNDKISLYDWNKEGFQLISQNNELWIIKIQKIKK